MGRIWGAEPSAAPVINEPFAIVPVYWTGCVSEVIGGSMHSTLFIEQRAASGDMEFIAVARLISPVHSANAGNAQARAVIDDEQAAGRKRMS